MESKVYKLHFINKNIIAEAMISSSNWLEFCANVKIFGFKKKSKITYSNLTNAEYETLLSDVFPPKKKKNPVEGNLVGIEELIKPFKVKKNLDDVDEKFKEWIDSINSGFLENELYAKPPKLDKELSQSEIYSEIRKIADDAKTYTIKRQPTFFCKETKVSYNELKKFFTDKAINSMIEDGFLDTGAKFPIHYAEGFNKENAFKPISFEDILSKTPAEYSLKKAIDFMWGSQPTEVWGGKPPHNPLTVMSDPLFGVTKEMYEQAVPKLKDEKGKPLTFWGGLDMANGESKSVETKVPNPNSYIEDDLKLEFDNVCDKLDFIIDQMQEVLSPDGFDIYISRTDSKQLNEAFGGKVKKYKGHKIIVS